MPPARISTLFLGNFLVTTFALQWWQEPSYPAFLWWLLAGTAATGLLPRSRAALPLALGTATALLAVSQQTHIPTAQTIDTYARNERVTITGVIADEPDRRPLQTKYTVETKTLVTASGVTVTPISGRVLVTDRRGWPQYLYNDRVRIEGRLQKPEPIETFHYDRYLSRYNIYSVMYYGTIEKVSRTGTGAAVIPRFSPRRTLYALKGRFEEQINRLYPEPHASFMAGLLTGSRRGIPEHLLQDFNATGLTHIIAISGYNITIVITIIGSLLFWLPVRMRFLPSTVAIVAFVIFVGGSAAVVRAAVMGILGLIALQVKRQTDVRLLVLWTLFLMLSINPKLLWYNAGFQLSFLAVLGLIELSPLLDPLLMRVPKTFGIRESLQMTTAAQLSAVPWIVLLFQRFSLIAPLANVLIAPFIPLGMLFGAASVLLSYITFLPGQLVAYIGWACLQWIILVAKAGAALPFSSVTLRIGIPAMVVYYVLLVAVIWKWSQKSAEKPRSTTTCTLESPASPAATAPSFPSRAPSPETRMHTTQ